jgi:hypothetical protein
MAQQPATARPRQVTVGSITAAAACFLLVVSLFDKMALVRSVEMRNSLDETMSRPPWDGLGVGVDAVVDLLHGLVLFSGALAAAGAILAIYAFQRHRVARIGLTVTAVLLILTATVVADLLPIVIAVAATMLWGREARAWFDGRPLPAGGRDGDARPDPSKPVEPPEPSSPSASTLASWDPPQPPPPSTEETPAQTPAQPSGGWARPAPTQRPFGQPAGELPQSQPGHLAPARPVPADPDRRPASVTAAVVVTWVLTGLTVVALGASMMGALLDKSTLYDEVRAVDPDGRLGSTPNDVLAAVLVVLVVGILWCLAAAGVAVAAARGADWARIVLVVSAILTALLSLLGMVGAFPLPIVHLAASVAVAVLLLRAPANRWFGRRSGSGPPWPPPGAPFDRPGQQASGQHRGQPSAPQPPGQRPAQQPPEQQPPGRRPPSGKPPVW